MRNRFQTNPVIFKIIVFITCCMLVMLYHKSKASGRYRPPAAFTKVEVIFKQEIQKNELKVFLKSASYKTVTIFFFSDGSKLLKRALLTNQCEVTVDDMKKGNYTYQCFDNGQKVKAGGAGITIKKNNKRLY